jgi:hypothetical protein
VLLAARFANTVAEEQSGADDGHRRAGMIYGVADLLPLTLPNSAR